MTFRRERPCTFEICSKLLPKLRLSMYRRIACGNLLTLTLTLLSVEIDL
jgi:hypothetical protein